MPDKTVLEDLREGNISTSLEGIQMPPFLIVPHPKAPIFAKDNNPGLILRQLTDEILSGNFPRTEEMRQLIRQAGYVNLWFFLRCIAADTCEYGDLTPHLHMDMCNFYMRQSIIPASKAAGFVARKNFKSSCWSHGGTGWDLNRNPNLTIGQCCGADDLTMQFHHAVMRIFDSSEMIRWCYGQADLDGDSVVPTSRNSWNDRGLFMNNRTKKGSAAPNLFSFTVGGTTQGFHFRKLKIDDATGDKQINSMGQGTADMRRIEKWLIRNTRSLLSDWFLDQVFICGTRWGITDSYEWIFHNIRRKYGYWKILDEYYKESPDNEYDVYYRSIIEDGRLIFPERIDPKALVKLAEEDWNSFAGQYLNNPYAADTNELGTYSVKECHLSKIGNEWFVLFDEGPDTVSRPLSEAYVVQAADPAATERDEATAKSSESANVVYAVFGDRRRVVLHVDSGFVETLELFRWMKTQYLRFKKYIRKSVLEAQGPFKMLKRQLRDYQREQGVYIKLRSQTATSNKIVHIRTTMQPVLASGNLYATSQCIDKVQDQFGVFPSGYQLDVIDAIALAEDSIIIPVDDDIDDEDYEPPEEMARRNVSRVTGY